MRHANLSPLILSLVLVVDGYKLTWLQPPSSLSDMHTLILTKSLSNLYFANDVDMDKLDG